MNLNIDVAKNVHEACLVNDNGEQIGRFIRLTNSKKSIEKFTNYIEKVSKELNAKPRIGMEATGIYWFSELSKKYKIHVYNPSQISGFASVYIRDSKTDKIDAKTIANI